MPIMSLFPWTNLVQHFNFVCTSGVQAEGSFREKKKASVFQQGVNGSLYVWVFDGI